MNIRFYRAAYFLGEGTEFMKSIKKHSINWNVTEPYSHCQNWAEYGIKNFKLKWKSTMQRKGLSPRLWDYGTEHDAELLSRVAPKDVRPPLEKLTGDTINLSEYLDFGFYDPVLYWDTLSGEKGKDFPGRWLGISHIVGAGMCCWLLNKKGSVRSRYTVHHVTKEDLLNPTFKETLEPADNKIKEKLADEKHKLQSCP